MKKLFLALLILMLVGCTQQSDPHKPVEIINQRPEGMYVIRVEDQDGYFKEYALPNEGLIADVEKPALEGKIFVYWTNENGRIMSEDWKLAGDITLKAVFADPVTVHFDTDGGEPMEDIVCGKGTIQIFSPPERKGYLFEYWALPDGTMWVNGSAVESDMTLKAVWVFDEIIEEPIEEPADGDPEG